MFGARCILVSCGSAIAFAVIVATVKHAHADAVVITRAMQASTIVEIFIDEEQVRAEIEIGAADVAAFANVLPDKLYEKVTGHRGRSTSGIGRSSNLTGWFNRMVDLCAAN